MTDAPARGPHTQRAADDAAAIGAAVARGFTCTCTHSRDGDGTVRESRTAVNCPLHGAGATQPALVIPIGAGAPADLPACDRIVDIIRARDCVCAAIERLARVQNYADAASASAALFNASRSLAALIGTAERAEG